MPRLPAVSVTLQRARLGRCVYHPLMWPTHVKAQNLSKRGAGAGSSARRHTLLPWRLHKAMPALVGALHASSTGGARSLLLLPRLLYAVGAAVARAPPDALMHVLLRLPSCVHMPLRGRTCLYARCCVTPTGGHAKGRWQWGASSSRQWGSGSIGRAGDCSLDTHTAAHNSSTQHRSRGLARGSSTAPHSSHQFMPP